MAFAFVQSTGAARMAGGSSVYGCQFASANTAGNSIIGVCSWQAGAAQGSTWTDSQGNTYIEVKNVNDATDVQAMAIAFCQSIAGGTASSVTVARGGSTTINTGIVIHEYSGLSSAHVSISNINTGSTATENVTSSNATPTVTPTMLFCAVHDAAGTSTNTFNAGAGYTRRALISTTTTPFLTMATEDQRQTVAGSTAGRWTQKQAHHYTCILQTFAESGGGGGAATIWCQPFAMMGIQRAYV